MRWQSMHIVTPPFPRQRANVERVDVPTLVAWTEDDPFIEADISAEFAAAFSGAEHAYFEDGGHYLQKTRSTEIAQAVQRMLAGPSAADRSVPLGPDC